MSTERKNTTTTIKFRQRFLPADESIPFRLVGTYEYDQCLNQLSNLIATSSEEQIAVYDEMLGVRPEFSFVSGVEMSGLNGRKPGDAPREWLDPFKRRGLAWMMALAKLELGATMSLYGKSKLPFTAYPPTQFDLDAFMRIMLDDTIAQMSNLANDPGFQFVLRSNRIDTWTLAYLRRIKLIRDMTNVLFALNDPVITAQLYPYEKDLKKKQEGLAARVLASQMEVTETRKSTGVYNTEDRYGGTCKELAHRLQGNGTGSPSSTGSTSPSGSPNSPGSGNLAGAYPGGSQNLP